MFCIGSIRPYITIEECKSLVQAFVISRLDYSNALLDGIVLTLISHLQRAQNCAARLVTRIRKRGHIRPILLQLHWLLPHTFTIMTGQAPVHLSDLVLKHWPARLLRPEFGFGF